MIHGREPQGRLSQNLDVSRHDEKIPMGFETGLEGVVAFENIFAQPTV